MTRAAVMWEAGTPWSIEDVVVCDPRPGDVVIDMEYADRTRSCNDCHRAGCRRDIQRRAVGGALPVPAYGKLRATHPVTYVPEAEAWLVTRYDDIAAIGRSPEVFSSEMPTGPVLVRHRNAALAQVMREDPEFGAELAKLRGGTRVLLFADPPEHPRQRMLVNRAFTPAKIRGHEPMIRRIAEGLVAELVERGTADIVADLGVPLPLMVIAELLGIPDGDIPQFKTWSDDVVKSIGNNSFTVDEVRAMMMSQYGLFSYFKEVISEHRAHPGDDLICDVLEATIDDEPLSDAEVMNMLLQFLVAGNETTTKLIAAAVLLLIEQPELAARLRGDMSLVPGFIEEALRLEPPIQGLYRKALRDTEVGGIEIKAGDHLMLVYAAGNRDESRFPSAERLDECRKDRVHLSFGIGAHHCLGASLARAEARVAVELLLERTSRIGLIDGLDALRYEPSYVIHGLTKLDVVLDAATA